MELKKYFLITKKWRLEIFLFVLVATLATTVAVFLIKPIYKASTLLMVNQASTETINLNDIMTSERLAKTYAEVVTKRPVLEKVINNLSLKTTPEMLEKEIRVELIRDTQLILIEVKNHDAQKAATIANSVVDNFSQEVDKLQEERTSKNTIAVVEAASAPNKSDSPKKALSILLAFFLSLLASSGIIILIEYLDDTFKDDQDVQDFLNLPNLGTLNYIKEANRKPGKLVALADPQSPLVESLREIRTNIQFSQPEKTNKTVVITSAVPAEGKSLISANLAVVMAQAGFKTVLIDADLHRPSQHEIFKLDNISGLSNLLTAEKEMTIKYQETQTPGLKVIPSGSFIPNPAEWLGSTRLHEILEKVRGDGNQIILLDTPPIGLVTDAAVLSSMTDGTVIVVELGKTQRDKVKKAIDSIIRVGGQVIGTVLNSKKPSGGQNGYYYYKNA